MTRATPTLILMDLKKDRLSKSKGIFNKNTSMASVKTKSMTRLRFQNLKSQSKKKGSLPEAEEEAEEVVDAGGDDDREHR
jgi:hypothetical protein